MRIHWGESPKYLIKNSHGPLSIHLRLFDDEGYFLLLHSICTDCIPHESTTRQQDFTISVNPSCITTGEGGEHWCSLGVSKYSCGLRGVSAPFAFPCRHPCPPPLANLPHLMSFSTASKTRGSAKLILHCLHNQTTFDQARMSCNDEITSSHVTF